MTDSRSASGLIDFSSVTLDFLIRRFSLLSSMVKYGRGWDEVSLKLTEHYHDSLKRRSSPAPAPHRRTPEEIWRQARSELTALLEDRDPDRDEIATRIRSREKHSTSSLLMELSFWLSRKINIPLATSTPLVAAALCHGALGGFATGVPSPPAAP